MDVEGDRHATYIYYHYNGMSKVSPPLRKDPCYQFYVCLPYLEFNFQMQSNPDLSALPRSPLLNAR